MLILKPILFSIILSTAVLTTVAQKPAKTTRPESQKFKPPKVQTFWGIYSDTAVISKVEALQLIPIPIRITDNKKATYTVTSYQFLYRRKAMAEDEETGKMIPVENMSASLFKSTPLPQVWQKTIQEELQSGEELHYFDVIVKDAQGRLFFAPEIKIKIK